MKKHNQVLVIGGGWAGVSAALTAAKAGAQVAVCERTDMLLGAGLVGGIMRNNGRFVAAEEWCICPRLGMRPRIRSFSQPSSGSSGSPSSDSPANLKPGATVSGFRGLGPAGS